MEQCWIFQNHKIFRWFPNKRLLHQDIRSLTHFDKCAHWLLSRRGRAQQ